MGALFLILSICFIGLGPVFYGHFFPLAGCCWIGLILWLLSPNDPKRFKKTPLHIAVETGDPDMVALLLEFGADRNAPATFENCCCCKKTPTQFVDMRTGGEELSGQQRASIKELLIR